MKREAENFADRLVSAIQTVGNPICLGMDPVLGRLPRSIVDAAIRRHGNGRRAAADAILAFCGQVLESLAGLVPVVKLQSACFELYGPPGIRVLECLSRLARSLGYLVIGDLKRGDIGVTSRHYAAAYLGEVEMPEGPPREGMGFDAITVSPYLGPEGLKPFVEACQRHGRGLFVVTVSSNPDSEVFQGSSEQSDPLYRRVAEEVARSAEPLVGQSGYSSIGAVVGGTRPAVAQGLRSLLGRSFLLVPGIGAQGATVGDLGPYFNPDGLGALVAVSRSILYAYEESPGLPWENAVRERTLAIVRDMRGLLPGDRGRRTL